MTDCRVCGNERGNTSYLAREMMYGLREPFEYFQCARCGCLQIAEFPADMGRYYPADYYSFLPRGDAAPEPRAKRALRARRLDHWLGTPTLAGRLLAALFGAPHVPDRVLREMRDVVRLRAATRILDMGCGNGERLQAWSRCGFSSLTGVDPFVAAPIRYRSGVTVHQRLPDGAGRFELVMMNHSFEHMPDPRAVLRQVAGLVAADHVVMIALPLCSSHAWEKYGINWVQLDAPRHFYLHSHDSMSILANEAGFEIFATVHNSTEFQFWGSEQYLRDIPLRDPRGYRTGSGEAVFTRAEMRAYEDAAARLNAAGRGDQASFYLRLKR